MLSHFLRASNNIENITYVGGYVLGYVGTTSNIVVSLTSLTGGVGTKPEANDLVIVCFATGSTSDRDLVVAGYTELTELYSNDTFDTNLVAAYKFMGATPDTSVTITSGTFSLADAGTVYVSVWRGVAGFDVPLQTNLQTETVLPNPANITPVTSGAVVVACGAGAYSQAGAQTYSSAELTGDFKTVSADDTNDSIIGGGYARWTTGSFNPSPFTSTITDSASYSAAAVTMALRPGVKTIQYIDSTFNTQDAGVSTTFTLTTPTGAIWGDYLIAILDTGTRTVTTPAGWTLLATNTTVSNNNVYGRSLTSAPAASYAFVMSSNLVSPTGVMLAYRNQSGTPITANANTLASTTMTAPAITNSEIGLVVASFVQNQNRTITTPVNMNQRENGRSTNLSRTMAVCDALVVGNFDATSATASASGDNTMFSIKLI